MRWLLLFPLLFLSFASHAGLFSDNEARDEIVKLRKYVKEDQDKRITDLQTRLDAVAKRLADVESAQQTQVMNLMGQLDSRDAEISQLRGQVEVLTHELEQAQQRQQQFYTDLDARLRKLEGGTSAAGSSDTAATAADAEELKAYEAAHTLFKANKFKDAAAAFDKFAQSYPNSKYAPSAQYWMGYSLFSQKNYKGAIAAQQALIQKYPDNEKVPDAMFNVANSQIQQADLNGAKKTLKDLIAKYPDSEAAPLAKKRLAVLESAKK
ncbi:MAG: tol-pal system protein YbgF [Methylobacillus sp.]|jgi:tol-pal system protein YbgF|nr:tol-pal system protein YbgF [Methylobacillus sp.]